MTSNNRIFIIMLVILSFKYFTVFTGNFVSEVWYRVTVIAVAVYVVAVSIFYRKTMIFKTYIFKLDL